MVRKNADKIRGNLHIDIHVGTSDILFCDNEIMHLYLKSLNIPHEYKKFIGVKHDLDKILQRLLISGFKANAFARIICVNLNYSKQRSL